VERFLRSAGTMQRAPFDEDGALLAVVDTPKGSRNKYKWDETGKRFRLRKVLPAGAVFPWDFGYLPGTRGEDGDPVDVLILMEEPAFAGCVVPSRLVGVIEAEQAERGKKKERNDRLIAVATSTHTWEGVQEIGDLGETLLSEIEHFFVSYNRFEDRTFEPIGRFGSRRARRVIERSRSRRRTPGRVRHRTPGKARKRK